MSLKDIAARAAVLDTLHKAIGDELKAARRELEDGLRAAKAETGTQKITVDLHGQDIGTASLVQPKAAAIVTDEEKFKAWVIEQGERFAGEIIRRVVVVTEVQPAFTKKLLAEMTAAGVAQWANPESGEIHDVPGVEMQGRAAYTRLTVPDAGKAAIGQAWQAGELGHLVLPQITAGGAE